MSGNKQNTTDHLNIADKDYTIKQTQNPNNPNYDEDNQASGSSPPHHPLTPSNTHRHHQQDADARRQRPG